MTEELSEKEKAELETLREQLVTTAVAEEEQEENPEEVTEGAAETSEETTEAPEEKERNSIWESFDKDPTTGYYVDPSNGNLIDPDSGSVVGGDELPDFEGVPEEAASASSSN